MKYLYFDKPFVFVHFRRYTTSLFLCQEEIRGCMNEVLYCVLPIILPNA
jgi:hypothetical protein